MRRVRLPLARFELRDSIVCGLVHRCPAASKRARRVWISVASTARV